jgi:hypothetical protein
MPERPPLVEKTFAIIIRGGHDCSKDYEATRVTAFSEDHACFKASKEGIQRKTIAQAINIESKSYQRFLERTRPR